MILRDVRITDFRSVDDSGEFTVGSVTCLVGKNEAGKSAVLLALAALNPHDATPAMFDKERDYPRRHLTAYATRHGDKDAVAVVTNWVLDAAEMTDIGDEFGRGTLTSDVVTVSRRYGQEIDVAAEIDFAAALMHLYDRFELDTSERAVLVEADTTSKLIEALPRLSSPTQRHEALRTHLGEQSVTARVAAFIKDRLPRFMYFAAYDRMAGAVQLEQTQQLIASGAITADEHRGARLFADFLDYAGAPLGEITSVTTFETFNARLKAASNNITEQVLEYWQQNPDLEVEVTIDAARPGDLAPLNTGTIARARVENRLHKVDTPFSERSAGFVWFFSFLVKFAQVKSDVRPVVLLLDEPGLTLHGKAQADLLRFFSDKLAPHHQVIYSTHSPFMVPAGDLASVKIVEDQVETKGVRRVPLGTKVRDDVLSRDPDTLFPLQAALGYEISQTLFVGKNTLLVEGPSDILYLQALSAALRRRNRTGLDARWTLCPAGGIGNVQSFVSLFAGNTLNVAVLCDLAAGDKGKVEALRRRDVLKAGRVRTIAEFTGQDEADVEDLLGPELLAVIVNGAYGLKGPNALDAQRIAAADATTVRVIKRVEALFRSLSDGTPMLDHYTPAEWLMANPATLDGDGEAIEEALARGEAVFETYNAML
jgi:predicted ATPase